MLTLVTTTRSRALSFSLVEQFIKKQTYREPYQWLVINDGTEPYNYTMGQEVVERKPKKTMKNFDGKRIPEISILANWLEAFPRIKGDKVVVVEDDDWIHPEYIALMDSLLNDVDLAGVSFDLYFKMRARKYLRMGNAYHASLAATAFRASLTGVVERICDIHCANNNSPFIDTYLWAQATDPFYGITNRLVKNEASDGRALHVGLKQMPGAAGLGIGHSDEGANDPQMTMLARWIGQEDTRTLRAIKF